MRVELPLLNKQEWNRSPPGFPGGRVLGCQFVHSLHVDVVVRNPNRLALRFRLGRWKYARYRFRSPIAFSHPLHYVALTLFSLSELLASFCIASGDSHAIS